MAANLQYVPPVPHDPVWRLSVPQYHRMVNSGILTEDDPVELLEGWLIAKMPQKPHHNLSTQTARDVIAAILPAGWYINVQGPLTTEDSEPEPDVMVVQGTRRQYPNRHPQPNEVALVIEVADTTLLRDRKLKKRLYARAGIVVYWILNLPSRTLEVYTQPSGPTVAPDYLHRQDYNANDSVPLVIAGHTVGTFLLADILP